MILNKKNLEKIWKLIYMAFNQKNKSGTKCWLTCLFNVKSATILSNGGKPENVLWFKGSSNEGLGSQIRYWMVWMNPIINYGTPFPNINLLLSLRWKWCLKQHSGVLLRQSLFNPDVSRQVVSCSENLWNFLLFNIHHLREIYCLFKLKSLLELVINQFWR